MAATYVLDDYNIPVGGDPVADEVSVRGLVIRGPDENDRELTFRSGPVDVRTQHHAIAHSRGYVAVNPNAGNIRSAARRPGTQG
jgi:hypothetical protein